MTPPEPLRSIVLRKLAAGGVLTVLTMIGLFWINYRPHDALWYWSAMFPAFGAVSIWNSLAVGRDRAQPLPSLLAKQALHWLGPIIVLWILFLQLERGQMDADTVGLMNMLVLAVTSYLAAIHLDLGFLWVGTLLAAGVVVATEIEAYLWLLAAIAVLGLGVAVVATATLRRSTRPPQIG
ncbi:MAG: hypothetical protein ACREQL_14885 [Candidatus Binatia bacterium]